MQEQEADNVSWALKESVALKKCLTGTLFDDLKNVCAVRVMI